MKAILCNILLEEENYVRIKSEMYLSSAEAEFKKNIYLLKLGLIALTSTN